MDVLLANAASRPPGGSSPSRSRRWTARSTSICVRRSCCPTPCCRACSGAVGASSCSSPRSPARRPCPATPSTTPPSTACADSRRRCARTCTAAAWALVRLPRFHPRCGHLRGLRRQLPPGAGTRSPEDVADGAVSAIEQDRGEVEVAAVPPAGGRAGANLAPDLSAAFVRRTGAVGSPTKWKSRCVKTLSAAAGSEERRLKLADCDGALLGGGARRSRVRSSLKPVLCPLRRTSPASRSRSAAGA